MFNLLNPLLLCCLIFHIRTASLDIIPMLGKKGGNITLPCGFKDKNIFKTELISQSEEIPLCETEHCSGRHYTEGVCSVVIKNLTYSDAGTYILRVFFSIHPDQPLQPTNKIFQLQIEDEIIGKIGFPLKLEGFLSNAGKVVKNENGRWMEVGNRARDVWSDRLTESDGDLTIREFKASDAGQYRALNTKGETLITLTVTESPESGPKENQSTEQQIPPVESWLWLVGVIIIIIIIMAIVYIWCKCCKKEKEQRTENSVELENLHQP